ncbi:MAG: hypothetical protein ACRDIB_02910, partial [Ardenticatenaceae bacterium]
RQHMTITLELSEDLQEQAEALAAARGQSIEEVALEALAARLTVRQGTSGASAMPLHLIVERDEDDAFVVGDEMVYAYGVGATLAEAVADYEAMLGEMYTGLLADESRLVPRLREQLDYLRQLGVSGGD